jgi:hypothetical protein
MGTPVTTTLDSARVGADGDVDRLRRRDLLLIRLEVKRRRRGGLLGPVGQRVIRSTR